MPGSRLGGELEQAVMDVVWALPDDEWLTVREVHERLAARGLAYTTVMTVMDRLAGKGLLTQEKVGRAYRYRPAATRADVTAGLISDALAGASADRDAALVRFVSGASSEDIAALRRALDELD